MAALGLTLVAGVPATFSTTPAVAEPASVAMVVAAPPHLTKGETHIRERWLAAGYQVDVLDDDTVTVADVETRSVGFVSFSVPGNAPSVSALDSVGVPVWVGRPAHFDDFGLTGAGGSQFGTKVGSTLTIEDTTHPAAAGRTGTVGIQGTTQKVSYGNATPAADVVASTAGAASVFTLETGDQLGSGGIAPSCRMTFPVVANAPATYTADGWAMFDAMTRWGLACPAAAPPAPPVPTGEVNQVVLVSMDGLNPQALAALGPTGVPAFHRMMHEGASTLNARTLFEKTNTLPNHISMVTSRWVDLPGGTGVTFNTDTGSTVHASAGEYVPSVFDVVHDSGGSTALFTGKAKFEFIDRSWNAVNGAPDVIGADDGTDKIDEFQRGEAPAMVTELITELQTTFPAFSMLHVLDPDRAGHEFGFMSPEYLQAVQGADTQLGRLLDAIAADTYLSSSTVVVLTADHGGAGGRSHSIPSQASNYTIPFMVWGFEVAAGADLYALNADDRANPLDTRPTYDAPLQPVRNAEVGNLVTDLLDLPVIPTSRIGTDQDLDVS